MLPPAVVTRALVQQNMVDATHLPDWAQERAYTEPTAQATGMHKWLEHNSIHLYLCLDEFEAYLPSDLPKSIDKGNLIWSLRAFLDSFHRQRAFVWVSGTKTCLGDMLINTLK